MERLARLAAAKTHLPAKNVPHNAVDAVKLAYDRGALRAYGFDANVSRVELPKEQWGELARLGQDVATGMVLETLGCDVHESDWSWKQLLRCGEISRRMSRDEGVTGAVESGLDLEYLPNLPGLLLQNVIGPADVLRLRGDAATKEFRRWLWSQPDPHDARRVSKAWLKHIVGRRVSERGWFKAARLATMGTLGSVTAATLGDLGTGVLAGAAVNVAFGAADALGVEALLRGPGPRRFAELVRRTQAANAADTPAGNRRQRRARASGKRGRRH